MIVNQNTRSPSQRDRNINLPRPEDLNLPSITPQWTWSKSVYGNWSKFSSPCCLKQTQRKLKRHTELWLWNLTNRVIFVHVHKDLGGKVKVEVKVKVKGKLSLSKRWRHLRRIEVQLHSFLNMALDRSHFQIHALGRKKILKSQRSGADSPGERPFVNAAMNRQGKWQTRRILARAALL